MLGIGFWAASASGGGGGAASMELISSTVLGSATSTISFTSIDSTYSHLQIRATFRTNGGGLDDARLTFNSDSGSNYAWHSLYGNGSSVASEASTSQTSIAIRQATGAEAGVLVWGGNVIDILDYAKTTKNKTVRYLNGLAGTYPRVRLGSGLWLSTAAITSLSLYNSNTFMTGTRVSLYGIKG